ncbi:MAG: hypothetical protein M1816_004749 [Peltula sp. TS41687]|nr:MAG: hypothetical protein M1816_004749 [Peltula sp. TS41687]
MRLLAFIALSIAAAVYAIPTQLQSYEMRRTEHPLKPHEANTHLARRQIGFDPYSLDRMEHDWYYEQCMTNWIIKNGWLTSIAIIQVVVQAYNMLRRPHMVPQSQEQFTREFQKHNAECVQKTKVAYDLEPTRRMKATDADRRIKETFELMSGQHHRPSPPEEVGNGNGDGDKNRDQKQNQLNSVLTPNLQQIQSFVGDQVKSSLDRFSNGLTGFLSKVSHAGDSGSKPMSVGVPGIPVSPLLPKLGPI